MTGTFWKRLLWLLALVLMPHLAWAQATGQISGQVTDASGGAMPGVTIEATNIATGAVRTAVTGTGTVVQLAIGPLVPKYPIRRGIDQAGAILPRQVNRLGSGGRQLVDEPTAVVLKLTPASES